MFSKGDARSLPLQGARLQTSMLQRWMDTDDLDLEDKIVVAKKEAEEFATGMGFLFYEVSVKIYNCKRSHDNLLGNTIIKHE